MIYAPILEIGRFLSQVPQILARLANLNFSAIELIANTHANERQESGKLRYLESVNSRPYDPEVLLVMDVKSSLKRAIVIALVSALPTFVSIASAHGGGHGSGGSSGSGGSGGSGASSGGHGSSGSSASTGGHGSSGSHSASSSNSGHSPSGSNSGSSSSVAKGGHSTGDPSTAPGTAVSGRSVRSKPEPVTRHFSTGWGHGDWKEGEETVDWQHHNGRRLFGFIWY